MRKHLNNRTGKNIHCQIPGPLGQSIYATLGWWIPSFISLRISTIRWKVTPKTMSATVLQAPTSIAMKNPIGNESEGALLLYSKRTEHESVLAGKHSEHIHPTSSLIADLDDGPVEVPLRLLSKEFSTDILAEVL